MSKEIIFKFDTGGQIELPWECLIDYKSWCSEGAMLFALAGIQPQDADRLICDRSIYRILINNDGTYSERDVKLFSTEDDPNGREQQNRYESVYVGKYGTIFIFIGLKKIEDYLNLSALDKIDMIYRERNI